MTLSNSETTPSGDTSCAARRRRFKSNNTNTTPLQAIFGLPLEDDDDDDNDANEEGGDNNGNGHHPKATAKEGTMNSLPLQPAIKTHDGFNNNNNNTSTESKKKASVSVLSGMSSSSSSSPHQPQPAITLEERVSELETKLAVLSRLLQRQQAASMKNNNNNGRVGNSGRSTTTTCASPPPPPPPPPPLVTEESSSSPPATPPLTFSSSKRRHDDSLLLGRSSVTTPSVTVPHLESPAPLSTMDRKQMMMEMEQLFADEDNRSHAADDDTSTRSRDNGARRLDRDDDATKQAADTTTNTTTTTPRQPHLASAKRNLSFRLLFDGDEAEYDQSSSAPPIASMTAAERSWLQPQLQEYLQQQQQQQQNKQQPQEAAAATTTTTASLQPSTATKERPAASSSQPSMSNNNNNNNSITRSSSLIPDDSVRTKWLDYLNSFQESTRDVDVLMQEFIQVPGQVERIMSFGVLVCLDSFLYMISILPIRAIWSCLLLVLKFLQLPQKKKLVLSQPYRFHRRHAYQLIQVGILYSIYRYVLANISIGKLYHWIRGQSMIKLYVLIAIVEVFDRLFSSLGQDCLDSMYWNTVSRPKSWRFLISIAVVWVYATIHAFLLFVHVETLNVAMNSADQALLTLLISGNFAEIKSTVFKKYNKPALFKITASDICERFKLGLFLSLVLLLNLCQGMDQKQFIGYLRICGIVWCTELVADWVKHSFITKFNFLPSKVYSEYVLLLAGDVTGIGHEGFNLDHSHAVVKRIGFAQIPLVCVMFRLLREAAKYARRNPNLRVLFSSSGSWWSTNAIFVGAWLLLLATKVALGRRLQRISLAKLRAAPELVQTNKTLQKKKNK